jgi:predicted CDP-diglyceride synthetase/phosphatidate cytidylyltransferase
MIEGAQRILDSMQLGRGFGGIRDRVDLKIPLAPTLLKVAMYLMPNRMEISFSSPIP